MPADAADRAREAAAGVRLLLPPAEVMDPAVAQVVREAVERHHLLRIGYADARGARTSREVEPQLLVAGPRGWYLTGWCRLRQEVRAFRLDRIHSAEPAPGAPRGGGRPRTRRCPN